jgi:hypothetical protein
MMSWLSKLADKLAELLLGAVAEWVCRVCGAHQTTPRARVPRAPQHCGKPMARALIVG